MCRHRLIRQGFMPLDQQSLTDLLSTSWDKRIAIDIAAELESSTGAKRTTVEEMRRLLAVKGYRELLLRMQEARAEKTGHEALRSVARAMRSFALERPGISAATFRSPVTDSEEWRNALEDARRFMMSILAECGVHDRAADHALAILRSLVRGFVINEVIDSFLEQNSYDALYENAIALFIAGLPALSHSDNHVA